MPTKADPGCCSVHVGIKSHSEHTQCRAQFTVAFQAKPASEQPQLGVTAHSAREQLSFDSSKTSCYSTACIASLGVPLHRPLPHFANAQAHVLAVPCNKMTLSKL